MKNPITTLHIQNFKTIKDLKVKCKRINIIIGKPNVGKSNFLEALSLLGGTYSKDQNKFLREFVRYNKFEDLFYDKEVEKDIIIDTNVGSAIISILHNEKFGFILGKDIADLYNELGELLGGASRIDIEDKKNISKINKRFSPVNFAGQWPQLLTYFQIVESNGKPKDLISIEWHSPIKKYEFQKNTQSINRFHEFLMPPHGNNIFTIVNGNKKLLKEVSDFFKEYKLKFGLRMADTSFEVRKQVGYYVYPTEYNLIADTLQRMIFNIAAIESNKESILLFEEPEAHSFPLYAQKFANKVRESKTNQFFITTHSPFILNTIVEKTPIDEVAVFIATYEKFQTKFAEVTHRQIREMLDYGNDIFFSPQVLG